MERKLNDKKTLKRKMGRRVFRYTKKRFFQEFKKQYSYNTSEELFYVANTGFAYESDKENIPVEILSKFLEKEKNIIDISTIIFDNKKINKKYIKSGIELLEKYGLDYNDINDYFYFKELEKVYYDEFVSKIQDENWKKYYKNRNYFKENFNPNLRTGIIKKKYSVHDFCKLFKLQTKELKKWKEKNGDLYKIAFSGLVYSKEKYFDNIPFFDIQRKPISFKFDYKTLDSKKFSVSIIEDGLELLEKYGLDYEDINNFYHYEELRENSFRIFLKMEVKDNKIKDVLIYQKQNK